MMNKQASSDAFDDNLFEAFTLLERGEDNCGVLGIDFIKIVQMLFIQYPKGILDEILRLLDKKEDEVLEFSQFQAGIKTVLMFDNYFEEMKVIFNHLNFQKLGKIQISELSEAITKLGKTKQNTVKVPTAAEIQEAYRCLDPSPKTEGSADFDEFLNLMFQVLIAKMVDSDDD